MPAIYWVVELFYLSIVTGGYDIFGNLENVKNGGKIEV